MGEGRDPREGAREQACEQVGKEASSTSLILHAAGAATCSNRPFGPATATLASSTTTHSLSPPPTLTLLDLLRLGRVGVVVRLRAHQRLVDGLAGGALNGAGHHLKAHLRGAGWGWRMAGDQGRQAGASQKPYRSNKGMHGVAACIWRGMDNAAAAAIGVGQQDPAPPRRLTIMNIFWPGCSSVTGCLFLASSSLRPPACSGWWEGRSEQHN